MKKENIDFDNVEERDIIRNKVVALGYSIEGDDYTIIPDNVQGLMVLLGMSMNVAIQHVLGAE